jgi:Protein of unknown function (DUF1592)/Protein of unknown function (DUF1588)/Protein of unknown function (DUF1587)/Protein of unknown function (DUF1585)/Protein of unknown function (DUF1595)
MPRPVTVLFALSLACMPWVHAAQTRDAFIEQYCADCHDGETKKGGLELTGLQWDLEKRSNFDEWVKVFDRVTKGEMPPKKKERPDPAATTAFLSGVGQDLRAFDGKRQAESGRAVLRRLNRVEYEPTMQELLGIKTPLAALLPADTPLHGFDTVAEGLRLSTLQMEKYLEAADIAIDAAINLGPEPAQIKGRWFLKDEDGVHKNLDKPDGTPDNPSNPKSKHRHVLRELPDAIVFFNEGYPAAQVRQMERHPAGTYRIRISAYGYQSKGESIPMRVYSDNFRDKQLLGWFEMTPDQARVVEFTARLRANDFLRIEPTNTGVDEKGQNVYNVSVSGFTGAGLALQWVEVEGPIDEPWPPRSLKQLFGDTPLNKIDESRKNRDKKIAYEFAPEDPRATARHVIERFAARAFRRPLESGEADRFVELATDELDNGRPFVDAMRVGFRGVLTAPQFLLFEEKPGKLDDYALASRLSYFLWSSMPDDELLAVAARKELSNPAVLRAQTERMLKDQRSRAFVQNFTGQWLDLRNIDATSPDKKLYPEADELLIVSMVQETEAFFAELLSRDLSAANVIHSDFAMLNSRLATHYGVDGVRGEELRKVSLPSDSPRGGILTQASVLKVTANGTTTSPVLRGAWVMKKLLGQPPSPPPPGIGSIEPDTRGATTIREQLAKHRDSETCASCHSNIDPPGFALESFDVIGGYRDRYRSQDKGDQTTVKNSVKKRQYIKLGLPVDATGEFADGRKFAGIQDFKKVLLENPNQVLAALTEKFVIYSTGAGISFADRPAVEGIVEKVNQRGGGLRTLVHEVVQSSLFQSK